MSFYYWVPDQRATIQREQLHAYGLSYAIEDRHTARGCDNGPDKRHGVVVCHGDNRNGKLGYFPELQQWKQIPSSDVWVGVYLDAKPRPDDLSRADQITGRWLTLDDGNRWLCPMARRWVEMDSRLLWDYNLPRRLTLNEEGVWLPGEVKPRYEKLWQLAMAYEDVAAKAAANTDGDVVRFTFDDIDGLAIGALQVNYRVGPVELDLLGIYDDQARQAIVRVLLDADTREEWIKKKLREAGLDGQSLSAGPGPQTAEETAATARQ